MTDFSKIECTLLGQDNRPQVFLGQANTLRVQLTNRTGQALPLTGGPPADPPPPGGPFAVRLGLASLVPDAAAQAQLDVAAPNWTARFFADDDYPAWVLSPAAGQVWAPQQTLTLTVAGLVPTVRAGTYYLDVELHNLDGLPPQARKLTLGVVNPPTPRQLRDVMSSQLASSTLYSTKRHAPPVRNELKLSLYNFTGQPLVPADQPWGPDEPRFILSLVTAPAAPGYYALTTPNALANIEVSVKGDAWLVTPLAGPQTQWLLRPQRHEVLGINQDAMVEIVLRNVVTSFQPGPTLLYVQGLNVPGYTDGFLTVVLYKEYQPMQLEYFRFASSGQEQPDQPLVSTTLEWKVNHASDVLLSGVGPVPHEGSCPVEPGLFARSYELTAFDTALGRVEEQHLSLRADPLALIPVGSIVAWDRLQDEVPAGWLVCDGTHGTPDLRDCFVPGAGDRPHTGPHLSVRSPVHSHSVALPPASVQVLSGGEHAHFMPANWYLRRFKEGYWTSFDTCGYPETPLQSAGEHTHTNQVHYEQPASLSTVPVPLPAWYALLYLQYQGLPG